MPAPTKQYNVRLPEHTQRQLAELIQVLGMTQTQILVLAIDRLHEEERRERKEQA